MGKEIRNKKPFLIVMMLSMRKCVDKVRIMDKN